MGALGVFVLGKALWNLQAAAPPQAQTIGAVGCVALAANAGVAWMLYRFRNGDANMRSVWICSRNDAIGNVAVMLAGLGVYGTSSAWPDLLVAAAMSALTLAGTSTILKQAREESRSPIAFDAARRGTAAGSDFGAGSPRRAATPPSRASRQGSG